MTINFQAVIDNNAIKNVLAQFIQAVVQQAGQANAPNSGGPYSWIKDFSLAVTPKKPYVGIKVTGPRRIGSYDEVRVQPLLTNEGVVVVDNEGRPVFGSWSLQGEREYMVSLTCVSDDEAGPNLATTLMAALQSEFYLLTLEAGGLYSVRNINPIMDATQQMPNGVLYERRAVLDFGLAAVSSILYCSDVIQTVAGQITVTTQGGVKLQIPLTPIDV